MSRFETDKVYIVAEIGQNHNGDLELAKALIDEADQAGASAVKSAKRDLTREMTTMAFNRPYDSVDSFGKTYGEHREFLELSPEEHVILKKYANNRGMDYFLSVCDIPSLDFALSLDPPLVKVPSKEITNLNLLTWVSECGRPIVYSTGMATLEDIAKAMQILGRDAMPVVCTSQYPTEYDNINLRRLDFFGRGYDKLGFSCHCPDPILGIVAVALGATYIEYHITLDREMKGSDHICSLEMDEFGFLVDGIKMIGIALGTPEMPEELPYYLKPVVEKLRKHKCEDGVYRL